MLKMQSLNSSYKIYADFWMISGLDLQAARDKTDKHNSEEKGDNV